MEDHSTDTQDLFTSERTSINGHQMKKTVFFHIGYYKTGTSAVQLYCHSHRKELLRHGILYPETGVCHRNESHGFLSLKRLEETGQRVPQWFLILMRGMKSVKSGRRIWEEVVREIESSAADRVIISSEDFIQYADNKRSQALIREIKDFLSPYDVRVVCYIRRQDDYCESWYNQIVKFGIRVRERCGLPAYESMAETHRNYLMALDAFEKVFSRKSMIVRIYDRKELRGGDIVQDLLYTVQDGRAGILYCKNGEEDRNIRLDNSLIELKRWCNHFNTAEGGKRHELYSRMQELFFTAGSFRSPDNGGKKQRLLSYGDRLLLLNRAEPVNREISERYFGGKWPLFSPVGEEERETPVVEGPGAGGMLDVMLGMMTRIYTGNDAGESSRKKALERRIREIEQSRSWMFTAPLRKLSSFLRSIRCRKD